MRRPPNEREDGALDKSRLEAFSDGVFAIAITLLVLDIRVPRVAEKDVGALLPGALLALWPQFFSFALSFAIIGVYWVAHHLMLGALRRSDRVLLWLNNLFLMWVVLIPFSASLLGEYRHARAAVIAYGLNLVLASAALQILWSYAARGRRLLNTNVSSRYVRVGTWRTVTSILVYLSACGMAFVSTDISLGLYWVGPLAYIFIQSRVDARLEREGGADAGA